MPVKASAKAGIKGTKTEEFQEQKAFKEVPKAIQVLFEILPAESPLEPGTKESLLRLQTKCDEETLELYLWETRFLRGKTVVGF